MHLEGNHNRQPKELAHFQLIVSNKYTTTLTSRSIIKNILGQPLTHCIVFLLTPRYVDQVWFQPLYSTSLHCHFVKKIKCIYLFSFSNTHLR